jgi:transcriptional regulator with XRE-family HTH domain
MRVRDVTALRAYLRLLGLSERELAIRAGLGHATLNHLLSGRRTRCTEYTASAIETALDCPRGLFFEPDPVEPNRAAWGDGRGGINR